MSKRYRKEKLSFYRRAVRASASVTKQNNVIHYLTKVDITDVKKMIKRYKDICGKKISFTSYIVKCFAKLIENHPEFNCFIRRNGIVFFNDITISVLIEKNGTDAIIPEPIPISNCQLKNSLEIGYEIYEKKVENSFEFQKNFSFLNILPDFLLKAFVKVADKNPKMALKYGKFAVTSVGMFAPESTWVIPHGTATILLTVGCFKKKVVKTSNGYSEREFLCLTISYDHDIIDGAPAARLTKELKEILESCKFLGEKV